MVKPIGKDDRVWFFGGFDDNVPLDENGIGHVEINLVEGQIDYGSKDTNHDVEFYKTKNQDNPIVRYDHQMVVYKTSLILLGGRQYENKNDGFTEFDLWSFDISKADTSPISMNRIIIMATVIPITCIAIGILGYVGFLKYKKNKKEKLMKNKEEFEEHDAIEIETSSHEKEIEISRSQHRVSLDAVQEPYREMQ
jgi:hypothetical protein